MPTAKKTRIGCDVDCFKLFTLLAVDSRVTVVIDEMPKVRSPKEEGAGLEDERWRCCLQDGG
jgi:hypothetical protein